MSNESTEKRPLVHLGTGDLLAAYEPSFCELVTNPDASDSNPQKHGYFVEVINRTSRYNKGKWYRCTDGNGRFWECKRIIAFEITDARCREV